MASTSDSTPSFEQYFVEGSRLLHEGKTAQAIPLLESAHRLDPNHVDANLNLSGAYILSKKFKQAISILKPLSEREPDNVMIWTNLGAAFLGNPVLAKDEEQMQAIRAFEKALEINPVAPSVAYNIGLIYRDRLDYVMAIYWFKRAIKANPNDQHAKNILKRLKAMTNGE